MSNRVLTWMVIAGLISGLLLTSLASVAASPTDNPGKGPPNIGKIVSVHYPKGVPAKGGIPGPPEGKEKEGGKLWYKNSGIHWADSDIPVYYVVNLPGGGDDGSFLDGIQEAFQSWEDDEESYIGFDYNGSFGGNPSSFIGDGFMNSLNEVGWMPLSSDYPNAIAVTSTWYNTLTKEIVEVDTAMNSDLPWSQTAVVGDPNKARGNTEAYDVQNIMIHEAGHWLMLGDMYNRPAKEQTMYGYSVVDELKKRSLESGDEAGVRDIYPGATRP